MGLHRWLSFVSALSMLAACGGDDGIDAADGGADASDGATGSGPTAPTMPALPDPGVCRDGWTRIESTFAECTAWADGRPSDCPSGEAHLPGTPGCAPVGGSCPSGPFPTDLPADAAVVYVQPGATGGDGSMATPWGTLAEVGLGRLPRPAVLALAAGDHDGLVRLPDQVTVWGACSTATRISWSVPDALAGVVTVLGSDTGVRNLTIHDSPRLGMLNFGAGRSVHVEGVAVERVAIASVLSGDGGDLTARRLAIVETTPRSDGTVGYGLDVEAGRAEVADAVLSDNADVGIYLDGPMTEVTLDNVAVRTTRLRGDGQRGMGMQVLGSSVLRGAWVSLLENSESGVNTEETGSLVELDAVEIRGTRQTSDMLWGRAVDVADFASIALRRAWISDNHDAGIHATTSSELSFEDSVVRDTRPDMASSGFGRGTNAQQGARATIRRVAYVDNHDIALFLADDMAAVVEDLTVTGTVSRLSDSDFGRALVLQTGVSVDASRIALDDNADMALFVDSSNVTLADLTVRRLTGRERDGWFGRAIAVQAGSSAQLTRVAVDGAREVAVYAGVSGTELTMSDVEISNTVERACAPSCEPLGMAISAVDGAHVSATRFEVSDAPLCGVQIARDGAVDLSDGEVRGCSIGACVQVDGYDLDRLASRVSYRDNGTNLMATTLPVPEAATPN